MQIELKSDSYAELIGRGRSHSFRGKHEIGKEVTAACDDQECVAIIAKAGRNSYVLKRKD